jgi:hypothetical protein
LHYLLDYKNFDKRNVKKLTKLTQVYPYSQIFHFLLLLNLKKIEDRNFDEYLSKTSIRLFDRPKLKKELEQISQYLSPENNNDDFDEKRLQERLQKQAEQVSKQLADIFPEKSKKNQRN